MLGCARCGHDREIRGRRLASYCVQCGQALGELEPSAAAEEQAVPEPRQEERPASPVVPAAMTEPKVAGLALTAAGVLFQLHRARVRSFLDRARRALASWE